VTNVTKEVQKDASSGKKGKKEKNYAMDPALSPY
jgi:hypothetical protein